MGKLGMDEDIPIENRMVSKAIENAQKRVESQNFDIRKHLLEYDDVMNKQRTEIYAFRKEILQGGDISERIFSMMDEIIEETASHLLPGRHEQADEWDMKGLKGFPLWYFFRCQPDTVPEDIQSLREKLSVRHQEII